MSVSVAPIMSVTVTLLPVCRCTHALEMRVIDEAHL